MTLLLETDSLGGVWTFTLRLATALRQRGHRVLLAVEGPGLDPEQAAVAERAADAVFSRDTRLEWQPDAVAQVREAGDWIRGLCETHRVDVAHLCSFSHAAAGDGAWPCARVLTVHSDITTWWHAVHGCAPPADYDPYRQQVRAGIARADAVAYISHAHRAAVEAAYPGLDPRTDRDPAATRVIYAGLPAAPELARRPRLTPSTDHGATAFAAGRFGDAGKNLDALRGVAAALGPALRLAGDLGQTTDAAFAGATRLGRLSPDATLDEMRDASVFLSPSRYEPYGLAALEAATRGCALLLSDIPTYRELWDGAAVFLPPDDPAAWRAAAEEVMGNADRRRHLLQAAADRAARRTLTRTADAYLALYDAARHSGGSSQLPAPAPPRDVALRTAWIPDRSRTASDREPASPLSRFLQTRASA